MLTLQYGPSVSCYGSAAQQVDPAEQENIAQVESTPESANVGYCDYTQLEAMQNCASDLVPGSESNQKRALSRNSDNDNNNNNNNTSPYDYYGHESGYGVPHYPGQNQYPMEASEYGVGMHTLSTPDPSHHQSSLNNNNNNQQTHYYEMSATIGPGTIQQRTFPVIYDPTHLNNRTSNPYGTRSTPSEPFLHIVEQPTNRIRYRYRSEKGSHGGLNGENSCHMKKTYPTVKLENYSPQSAPVYIRVSLATNEEHPKLHVHKLMGKHCSEDGACTLPVNENLIGVFQNLGILFIGKKEVPEILFRRKLTDFQLRSNPTQQQPLITAISDKMQHKLRQESEREAKDMNLNSVRICFEAFQLQNDALYSICSPVYSRPIANQKSPDSGELKIIRINRYCGSVRGGDEVYILCEKVNKKEIRVRFFEIDQEGNQQWESFGSFSESDVHHQVAIVFRTPPYRNQNLLKPVRVFLQLYRQRDGEFSEPRTFIYKPKLNGGCGGASNDNGYSNGNDDLTDILGSKSGLQESVLSQIKLENQPPGYKRKKFIHNQSAKNNQTTKASSQSINSTADNNSSTTTTSSGHRNQQQTNNHNNSRNSSRTSSTISTRKSNISDKLTIKTESTSSSISEITTNNSKVRPASCAKLSSVTTRTTTKAAAAQNQPQISNANSSDQMEVNFCQGTDVKIQPDSCTIQFSSNGKRSRESRSALSSTNSSISPSSSPSATSPTSPLMSGLAGATGDSSSVPLQSFNQLIHSNHHQFPQQSQHLLANNQSAVGPIDFDHLDSMWQSAPPPMSAEVVNQHHSNLFQNFLSMQNSTPANSQLSGFCPTPQMQSHHHQQQQQQQQQQSSQNQQSFVEVLLNHHQDQMANGSAPHLHSHLQPLHHGHHSPSNLGMLDQQQSIISLDLAPSNHGTSSSASSASSLISHSPSMMSSGSPSSVSSCSGTEHHHLSSSSSASSPQQSSNFQFNPNIGTLQCMLYS